MKILFVLCSLIVFASASFYDALDQESSELVSEFLAGMDKAPALATILEPEFAEAADTIEEDIKSQLARSLRQVLDKVLKHIRDSFENAENIAKDLMAKAAQLVEKLKEFSGVAGGELVERIRERIGEWVKAFQRRLNPSSAEYALIRVPLELDEKNLMENVKQNILERLNLKEIVEYVKGKLFQLKELGLVLLEALGQSDAADKLRNLLEVLLPGLRQDYSLKDIWQKVKDFFKDLGVKISDKFSAFANWVKDKASTGWENISDKAGKLKELAKIAASKAGTMSKQVAQQALQFFQEHKEVIGEIAWIAIKTALSAAIASAG